MGPSTPQLFCFPFPFETLPNGTRPEETATFLLEWLLLLLELESVPLALSVSLCVAPSCSCSCFRSHFLCLFTERSSNQPLPTISQSLVLPPSPLFVSATIFAGAIYATLGCKTGRKMSHPVARPSH